MVNVSGADFLCLRRFADVIVGQVKVTHTDVNFLSISNEAVS